MVQHRFRSLCAGLSSNILPVISLQLQRIPSENGNVRFRVWYSRMSSKRIKPKATGRSADRETRSSTCAPRLRLQNRAAVPWRFSVHTVTRYRRDSCCYREAWTENTSGNSCATKARGRCGSKSRVLTRYDFQQCSNTYVYVQQMYSVIQIHRAVPRALADS